MAGTYRDDVTCTLRGTSRENLAPGTYVKLPFRFRAEDANRRDFDTERMWVLVTEVDDDGYYVGTLENDPKHDGKLRCGDTIHFHPLHVMEVIVDSGP